MAERTAGADDPTKTAEQQDPQPEKTKWGWVPLAISVLSFLTLMGNIGYQSCVKGEIQDSINHLEKEVELDLKDVEEEITEDLGIIRTDIRRLDDRLRSVEVNVGKLESEISRHSHNSVSTPRVQFTVNSASQK